MKKGSFSRELLLELIKAGLMLLVLVLAAGLSFSFYEKKLVEFQSKQLENDRRKELQHKTANDILDASNEIFADMYAMKLIGDRFRNFKKLDPSVESLDNFLVVYDGVMSETSPFSSSDEGAKLLGLVVLAQSVLDDETADAFYSYVKSATGPFEKAPIVLDRIGYLMDKYEKQGQLVGTDLVKVETTISAVQSLFNPDIDVIESRYRNLISTMDRNGYLGRGKGEKSENK